MQISIPQFKKWIYEHLSSQTEGKLNLMHTAYLIHQFDATDDECRDMSNVAFTALYNRYFEPEKYEVNLFQHSSSVMNNFPMHSGFHRSKLDVLICNS